MLHSKHMTESGVPFPDEEVWHHGIVIIRPQANDVATVEVFNTGPPASGGLYWKWVTGATEPRTIRIPALTQLQLLPRGLYVQLTNAEVLIIYRPMGPLT
jgi:hypothetical protein